VLLELKNQPQQAHCPSAQLEAQQKQELLVEVQQNLQSKLSKVLEPNNPTINILGSPELRPQCIRKLSVRR
jgi:gamma-glutamyl phosphate reductase